MLSRLRPRPQKVNEDHYPGDCVELSERLRIVDVGSSEKFRAPSQYPAPLPENIRFVFVPFGTRPVLLDPMELMEIALDEQLDRIRGISVVCFIRLQRIYWDKVLFLFSDAFLPDYCFFTTNLFNVVLYGLLNEGFDLRNSTEKAILQRIISHLEERLDDPPTYLIEDTFVNTQESLINIGNAKLFAWHFKRMLEIELSQANPTLTEQFFRDNVMF